MVELRSIIGSVLNFTGSKTKQVCTAPCDGFVLKMHYQWTFCIFLGVFFTVFHSWYYRDFITCVSHFDAEKTNIRLDYINVCLSYPFLDQKDGSRRYLLFYRWLHWTVLIFAGIHYIPRKVSKMVENEKFKALLEDISKNSSSYDTTENQVFQCVDMYMKTNLHTHNDLYFKYIGLNVLALFIDISTLIFLDLVLQGNFLQYGFKSYPFERDPKTFRDYMSNAFPPFASCELDRTTQLVAKRIEVFGCHLTLMELYEKIFVFVWMWLILLMIITSIYIVFMCLMMNSRFRYYILRPAKPIYTDVGVKMVIGGVNKNCKIGDIFVLYKLKEHLSHARFYELLFILSKERFWEIPNLPIDVEKQASTIRKVRVKQRVNVKKAVPIPNVQGLPNIGTLR